MIMTCSCDGTAALLLAFTVCLSALLPGQFATRQCLIARTSGIVESPVGAAPRHRAPATAP